MADGNTETFRYTEDDLIQAARLFAGKGFTRPKVIAAYVLLWLAGMIFFMNQVSGRGTFDIGAILDHLGLVIALSTLPFALVFAWASWVIPALARRNFRQQRALQGDFTYAWSEQGLSVKTEFGTFEMPWDHFVGWAENSNTILILETDRLYRVVPKRVLDPDQQAGLRQHCARIGA